MLPGGGPAILGSPLDRSPMVSTLRLAVCSLVVTLGLPAFTPAQPNVLVILTDDQGWGDLSLHGNRDLRTPNLDSLARAGAQFTQFFVCPVCSPTRAEFLTGVNEGRAFLSFVGHSSFLSLGNANLLTAFDVPTLTNTERLPVVTAFTCLAGQFGFPGQEAVSEALVVHPERGAAAMWSPSGLSLNHRSRILAEGFYDATFEDGELVIGEVILKAQRRYAEDGEDKGGREIGTTIPGGSVFRVVEYSPGVVPRNHRTDSIDYAVVISGEIEMEMDGTVVQLKAGDVLVQRGTIHNWINNGTQKCVIAFVLIGSTGDTAVG